MSTLHVSFYTMALSRPAEFFLVKPDKALPPFLAGNPHYKRPTKTLILLHGFSGDCHDWLYNGGASMLSMQYNLAIVMPTGGISLKNLTEYAACPVIAACGGSYMCPDKLIEAGAWNEITELCKQSVEIVKEARK